MTDYLKSHREKYGGKLDYIPNALDFTTADPEKRLKHIASDSDLLKELGFSVRVLDLREYFGKQKELQDRLSEVSSVWVSGGNTFVLRQAMNLSGFDELMSSYLHDRKDFLYGAYSAGCCVLSPDLSHLQQVDDPNDFPYPEITETIWDGLGYIDFAFLPHYRSDHPESADIEKEVEYCIDNKILFIALRDGEVLIEKTN
ncbi:MAG TPA: Type 1 glutamine amidotransferase-like domain-containing protein [Oligoflexia bacterium]|nr:Type 1 glutamine amidotransferase-like domain-containing protein [Oligoflexia bacterium]HMP48873.1 Type 1 glutamine amidotransferase-like domain-containing protein [Oligoflexia bacterium]